MHGVNQPLQQLQRLQRLLLTFIRLVVWIYQRCGGGAAFIQSRLGGHGGDENRLYLARSVRRAMVASLRIE